MVVCVVIYLRFELGRHILSVLWSKPKHSISQELPLFTHKGMITRLSSELRKVRQVVR